MYKHMTDYEFNVIVTDVTPENIKELALEKWRLIKSGDGSVGF